VQGLSWCNRQTLQQATWDDVRRRVSAPVGAAIDKVMTALDGGVLSRDECALLADCDATIFSDW